MAQQRLKFNDYTPPTVTEDGYVPSFATTSTSNSGRLARGGMVNIPLFTVQAYDLKWANMSAADVSRILREILGKSGFTFHYYSIYWNEWRDETFYVANANDIQIKSLKENKERVGEFSLHVTGTNPIM